MTISIEIPVIRGGWLVQCIDSVLQQNSSNWFLTLYWDCGDEAAKELLTGIQQINHPRIQVLFGTETLGIARARQFITEQSRGEWILPLDDDDVLQPGAVKLLLQMAVERPWASIIRAKRGFIDDAGEPVLMTDWFAFERRKYFNGATIDVSNHSQPYAVRRSALLQKGGWSGYSDYRFMGEDCGCFMKAEETGEVELLDAVLYAYRIHQQRTSLNYTPTDAEEMWRRITDEAIARRKAPVERVNDAPPYIYKARYKKQTNLENVGVIIPFWETNEKEIDYRSSRPVTNSSQYLLGAGTLFHQPVQQLGVAVNRISVAYTAQQPVEGILSAGLFKGSRFSPCEVLQAELSAARPVEFEFVDLGPNSGIDLNGITGIELSFTPKINSMAREIILHTTGENGSSEALMRLFESAPGHCRIRLEKGLQSLKNAGIKEHQVYLIEDRNSSAANRNKGFRQCDKEWICLMDDDAQVRGAETLFTMLHCMVEHEAGLCGPKLLTPSGKIYSCAPYTDPLTQTTHVAGMGETDYGQYNFNRIVPWLPSTVLMVHQSVALSTGGFDEAFAGSQHEDVDFCLRARARGFRCCYAGTTSAIHDNMLRNGNFSLNMNYLKERWKNRPDLFAWPPLQ